ncbi:MAG TPA: hypothetical protein VJ914_32475 [Pseudonocardiaceae bacterium]|nr:hypothetical protein [Pseudonocardiaceae bacterium]
MSRRSRQLFQRMLIPAAVLVVAGAGMTATASAQPLARSVTAAGITASVTPSGGYRLQTTQPASWSFSGSVGHQLTSTQTKTGSDAIGSYQEVDFSYTDTVARSASIRVYQNQPTVLFSATNTASTANGSSAQFPSLSTPNLPYRESFQDQEWSPYQFNGTPAHDSPLLTFDGSGNGFLVSPADNFSVANLTRSGTTLSMGITSSVGTLPAGFTHRTLLTLGSGVNATYDSWGSALMALGGKKPIANDGNATLNKLGYWTDNGASYYYKYNTSQGYTGTLTSVAKDFAAKGVPLGYMQLDSWWYPKGSSDSWQGNGTNRGGEYTYRAAPALFPNGLASFQRQLNLPLVTHARWVDPSSPYHQQYTMSNDVITDPSFWNSTMNYLASSGVITYEQDWLSADAQPKYNLSDPNAFMGNMAHSGASNNITLQYCMALPWNILQSSQYQNAQTDRVNSDRFDRTKWDSFLFDSRMVSAVGELPWTDVFMSGETDNLLLSTLSNGMVGVGDAIGAENVGNLKQSVRSDGVVVKPDEAIVPINSVYVAMAQGGTPPMVASTYSDHNGGLRDGYVFAYARNNGSQQISFTPGDAGVSGAAYVYNYFTGAGTVVPAGGHFTDTVGSNGSYYVVAPLGQSGIGFLGDAGKFVSLGGKRIAQLSDNGSVHATVSFASGENSVTLHGYAPSAPKVSATDGSAGAVSYDSSKHQFTVSVTAGSDHSAAITLGG